MIKAQSALCNIVERAGAPGKGALIKEAWKNASSFWDGLQKSGVVSGDGVDGFGRNMVSNVSGNIASENTFDEGGGNCGGSAKAIGAE